MVVYVHEEGMLMVQIMQNNTPEPNALITTGHKTCEVASASTAMQWQYARQQSLLFINDRRVEQI